MMFSTTMIGFFIISKFFARGLCLDWRHELFSLCSIYRMFFIVMKAKAMFFKVLSLVCQ